LLLLNNWLTDHGFTTVLSVKRAEGSDPNGHYEFLDYLADCVIHLDQRVSSQVTTRRLRVIKYRGSGYGRNEYPYVISRAGVRVVPISAVELRHQGLGAPVTSGLADLDAILGGGYLRGSSVLIAGAAGTGKTTLASIFACSASARHERVLYVGFEESMEAVVSAMLSSGTDLRPALHSGTLQALTAMPESMGSEEHLLRVLDAIEDFCPQHVIVDAVSAARRMGSERAAFDFLVRLLNVCRERGITTLLLNQTAGAAQPVEVAGEEISSLVDAIVFLRYTEIGGEINRLITVAKSRGSAHSNQIREFRITHRGVEIADVYAGSGGVLTGVARQEQEASEAADSRRKHALIQAKRAEIARRRAELDAETDRLNAAIEQARIELCELEAEQASAEEARSIRNQMRARESSKTHRQDGGNA
jgi:circadian clock protein KaiC